MDFIWDVFPKDSFDRFGDDLCQHLLSYLSLEESLRYECVCKQWQRYVFGGQHNLIVYNELLAKLQTSDDNQTVDLRSFETIVRKMPYISYIEFSYFGLTDQILALIVNHCHRLRRFFIDNDSYQLSDQSIEEFFAKFSPQLQKVIFYTKEDNCRVINRSVKRCNNLLFVDTIDRTLGNSCCLNNVFDVTTGEVLFPRLKKIIFNYRREDSDRFGRLVDTCAKTLTSVDVTIDDSCHPPSIRVLFNKLSQINNLLNISIDYYSIRDQMYGQIGYQLTQLGRKCRRLQRLGLVFNENKQFPDFEIIIKTINTVFKDTLRRLQIEGFPIDYTITSLALSKCRRLKSIVIVSVQNSVISDHFFADIDKNLPNLTMVYMSNGTVTDQCLHSVSKLRKLCNLMMYGHQRYTPAGAQHLMKYGRKLDRVVINRETFT